MREINTSKSPKNNLNNNPPHNVIKNVFSDLFIEYLISRKPKAKLMAGIENPIIIELNIISEIWENKKRIVRMRIIMSEIIELNASM